MCQRKLRLYYYATGIHFLDKDKNRIYFQVQNVPDWSIISDRCSFSRFGYSTHPARVSLPDAPEQRGI